MKKRGRPKADDPFCYTKHVKLKNKDMVKLLFASMISGKTQSEIIREGLMRQFEYMEIEKYYSPEFGGCYVCPHSFCFVIGKPERS